MGQYCTKDNPDEDSEDYNVHKMHQSGYYGNKSSLRLSDFTAGLKKASGSSLNESMLSSMREFEGTEKLNHYHSIVLEPSPDQNSPPSSMYHPVMNKKSKIASAAYKKALENSSLKRDLDLWQSSDKQLIGPICYDNGDTYLGEFVRGQKDGYGDMIYTNGAFYRGMWKADYRHGKGVFAFPDGSVFIGNFKHDKANGVGESLYFVFVVVFLATFFRLDFGLLSLN